MERNEDWDRIDRDVEQRFACRHQQQRLAYIESVNAKRMYLMQCDRCGKKTSNWLPLRGWTEEQLEQAEPYNRDLEQEWLEKVAQYRRQLWSEVQERRAAAMEEQRRAYREEYLQSPEWKAKRELVLKRDNNLCQHCLRRPATQVHHLSYEGVPNEPLWNLRAICRTCHAAIHGEDQADPWTIRVTGS